MGGIPVCPPFQSVGKLEGRISNLKTLMGFTRSSSGHGKRSEDVPSRLLVSLVSSFFTSQCRSALLFKGHAWVSVGGSLAECSADHLVVVGCKS